MNFSYDEEKLASLENDLSLFHPTETQIKIIYDLGEKMAKTMALPEVVARNILISSILEIQKEKGIFHYKVEKEMPALRVKYSEWAKNRVIEKLFALLEDPEDEDMRTQLSKKFDAIFAHYVREYASRD